MQDDLVSSTVVDVNNIGNRKEFLRLTFEFKLFLGADKKVMLEMSALETFCGGQFMLSIQLITSNVHWAYILRISFLMATSFSTIRSSNC